MQLDAAELDLGRVEGEELREAHRRRAHLPPHAELVRLEEGLDVQVRVRRRGSGCGLDRDGRHRSAEDGRLHLDVDGLVQGDRADLRLDGDAP